MAKYINAEDLRNEMYQETFEKDSKMQKWESGCWIRYKLFENVLDKMPSADVKENTHGEWIEHEDKIGMIDDLMCSLCGHCTYEDYPNFCPNCGADMKERKETE